MNGRLIYVAGPSGSGKDSVIGYARSHLPPEANVFFARRTVTRPATAGGERHRAVTPVEFDALRAAGEFVMHWWANGHAYGIGREMLGWLDDGRTVVVNGSRAHVRSALADFPALEVVHVFASPRVLRERLLARGREDAASMERRLDRGASLALPEGTAALQLANDGALEHAGEQLLAFLLRRPV